MSLLLYYGLPADKSGSLIYNEGGMEEIRLMKGNEVVAEAAVRCGCDGYFGYPITPQSEILETLTAMRPWETTGMVVLQAESEVAAVNMLYGGAACGKVYAALQIAGVGGAQRAVTADFNGRALGKGTGCHNDLVGIARFVCRFGADKAVHRRAGLDACAEPLQRGGTAGIKASHNIVMVGGARGSHPPAPAGTGHTRRFSVLHTQRRGRNRSQGKYHAGCPACSQGPCRCRGR